MRRRSRRPAAASSSSPSPFLLPGRDGTDLDPVIGRTDGVHRDRVLRGTVDRLAGPQVELAAVARAHHAVLVGAEVSLREGTALVGAFVAEREQLVLDVGERDPSGRGVVGTDLAVGQLGHRGHAVEAVVPVRGRPPRVPPAFSRISRRPTGGSVCGQRPRPTRITAAQLRCTTVSPPRTTRTTRAGRSAPGIARPTINATYRSNRWKSPSESETPTSSASARTWLTESETTSVTSASAAWSRRSWPSSDQNRQPNTITSETRSRNESRNAPNRDSSPRRRATAPSRTSNRPAGISRIPGANRIPIRSIHPITTFVASERRDRCHERNPARYAPASAALNGHRKIQPIARPTRPCERRGGGMSRTRAASSPEDRTG